MANKDKLLESAQKFLAKGQTAKAIGEYQKLIEAFPKDYRNRQKLAELLGREKRNDEAQPHYEAVARNFAETGFYLKAIAIYKQMQKIEPSRVDLYLRLAELNEKQGLIGNALNEYRSLIAFYETNRMTREAVGVLHKMVTLEPENIANRARLIETLAAIDETADALEQLRSLVRILAGKSEYAKIVKLYEKFIEICPDGVEYQLPLADALLKSGQADKALTVLKNLLRQSPDHPELLSVLTDCHLALGHHEDARLSCQHLLKDNPQDLDLRERYVRICLAGGDAERALESLEDGKEAFSQAGRIDGLRELYEALQPLLPDNPRLRKTLAAIYEATGEGGAALMADAQIPATEAAVVETAAVQVVQDALGDVEPLDLVGEAVAPLAVVPPLGQPLPPAKDAATGAGIELELDLDLDLDLGAAVEPVAAEPQVAAPAAAPAAEPAAQPVVVAESAAVAEDLDLELELEFDLGSLELPDEPVAPVQAPSATPVADDLTFVVEMPSVEELPPDVDLAPGAAAVEEPLPVDEPPPGEGMQVDMPYEVEVADADEIVEAIDELEEDVDFAEFAADEEYELPGEVADIAAGAGSDDLAPLEILEELDEVEEYEELEELEEIESVDERTVSPPPVFFSPQQLRAEIEEAEFYLRQGLFDDADRVVGTLLERYGDLPELTAKASEIAAGRGAAATVAEEPVSFSELMAGLGDEELLGATDFLEGLPADGAEDVGEFTEETAEDFQSHFDLGIAYKEMGLLDEAIREFDQAMRDPSRHLDGLTFKGQCQAELGQIDSAEATYRLGLSLGNLTEEGRVALSYELGLLYEVAGRPLEALEMYQFVADRDLFFRDVTDKVKSLRQSLGIDDQAIEAVSEGGAGGGRDRISFV